jgi:hypothetical protein
MIKVFFSIVFITLSISVFSQSGGDNTYDFLNITNSARVASLGGQQISINDNDLNLVYHNPSLLTPEMDNNLVLNYINYFAGTNFGYVAYAWKPEKDYSLAVGLHYLNYGEFIEADASGIKTGTFRAADYALNLFWSKPLIDSVLNVGVNIKPIYSQYEAYSSLGLAFDAGITYSNSDRLFSAALVVKNMGMQITRYNPNDAREPLPFEIQLGITKQLQHAPFRFSIIGWNLQKPNLLYETEQDAADQLSSSNLDENDNTALADFTDNVFRHINFGVEFIPSNNFYINLGYNYKRRQELKIEEKAGMVGFSYGFGLKIKKLRISYGRATYHLAGASNHFSLTLNLSEFNHRL